MAKFIPYVDLTAGEWLKRWDDGEPIWSVEMGGMSPGYEQCIQVTALEILRVLIARGIDLATIRDDEAKKWGDEVSAKVCGLPVIDALGLSGAQYGAAMNLACCIYRRGPGPALADDVVQDRLIQVSKDTVGPIQQAA